MRRDRNAHRLPKIWETEVGCSRPRQNDNWPKPETSELGRQGSRVKPAPFRYAKARSVEHAVELLCGESDARPLAGGQSLIATLNMRLSSPRLLVDLNGIGGLDHITHKDGLIEIGALVRHVQAERSEGVARQAPLI